MNMQESLYTVEPFKFTILDAVPRPDAETAYLLFREGRQDGNFLLITSRKPVMSHQIRSGGYNRKVTVSLAWRHLQIQKNILDESGQFEFYIALQVDYRVKDAQYVYENGLENVEPEIKNKIYAVLRSENRNHSIENQVELEDKLYEKIAQDLETLDYLETAIGNMSVSPDDRARKIIDGKLDTMAEIVVMQSDSELTSEKVEQQRKLEVQRLEAERDIEEKRRLLTLEKVKEFREISQAVGDDAATVMAYIKDEISSVELDERIQKRKDSDLMTRISMLKQLVDIGGLDGRLLERVTVQLLGVEEEMNGKEDVRGLEQKEEEEDMIVEDSEEY